MPMGEAHADERGAAVKRGINSGNAADVGAAAHSKGGSMVDRILAVLTKVFAVLSALALAFGLTNVVDLSTLHTDAVAFVQASAVVLAASIALYHAAEHAVKAVIAHYRA